MKRRNKMEALEKQTLSDAMIEAAVSACNDVRDDLRDLVRDYLDESVSHPRDIELIYYYKLLFINAIIVYLQVI